MAIKVLNPGMLTTVQDLGRYGYQRYGIPPAGAMDPYALRIGNLLLGNDENEAGLEVTILGPTLQFEEDCWIAITGADLGARLNRVEVPLWETIPITSGDVLSFSSPRKGMRAYITVAGGIDVPAVLGSKSTYLRARLGGLEGQALKKGDRLIIKATRACKRRLPQKYVPSYELGSVRVILGPECERFSFEGIKTFLSSKYKVLPESDRMGLRLQGPKIEHVGSADIISEPVCTGTIQVPGNGQPIVLLADRQTIGGYTKIATVISADIHRIAQAKPGDMLSFKECSLEEAHQLLRDRESQLAELKEAIKKGELDYIKKIHLQTSNRTYDVEVKRDSAKEFTVKIGEAAYEIAVLEKKTIPSGTPSKEKWEEHTLNSPMPGKIIDICVSVGEEVKRGEKLIVLEAMKMENELLSPVDGIVSEIKVKAGAQVEDGQVLMVIEEKDQV